MFVRWCYASMFLHTYSLSHSHRTHMHTHTHIHSHGLETTRMTEIKFWWNTLQVFITFVDTLSKQNFKNCFLNLNMIFCLKCIWNRILKLLNIWSKIPLQIGWREKKKCRRTYCLLLRTHSIILFSLYFHSLKNVSAKRQILPSYTYALLCSYIWVSFSHSFLSFFLLTQWCFFWPSGYSNFL